MVAINKEVAALRGLGPIYSFVVLIHVWFIFFFVNAFAIFTSGLTGLRTAWKANAAFNLSVFQWTLIGLAAFTILVLIDSWLSYRTAESKKFCVFAYSMIGILTAGLWADIYSLWTGPLDDRTFFQLVTDEPIDYGRGYIGLVKGESATGCHLSQQPCLSVELDSGELVVANLRDAEGRRPTPVVGVDERVGRFSEEIWYEAYYFDHGDSELLWRSVVRRYR